MIPPRACLGEVAARRADGGGTDTTHPPLANAGLRRKKCTNDGCGRCGAAGIGRYGLGLPLRCERPKRGRPERDSPTRPCSARGWRVGLAPLPPAPGAYSRLHPRILTLREVTGKSRPGTDRVTGARCQLHTPSPPLSADLLSSAAAAYNPYGYICQVMAPLKRRSVNLKYLPFMSSEVETRWFANVSARHERK